MVTSFLDKETNIVEAEFKGNVHAEEINDFIIAFKENCAYPRVLKCIINATDAKFKFSLKDVNIFNQLRKEAFVDYKIVICAIIVNHPATAALSTLYSNVANTESYKFKVFSTRKAVVFWIDSF
ncbi:hypothetical protein [Tamlana crocina]|uniref:STAS/SEC14 domain-containing protein n=1 Tax=Tamlana crocina TaxID=393006 RepID=A0ABX1DE16_9FLAO|nr:hypothetical protein [Tamlana crocina]NJX15314.1 hypothetical protein [Tamlana crocina]